MQLEDRNKDFIWKESLLLFSMEKMLVETPLRFLSKVLGKKEVRRISEKSLEIFLSKNFDNNY